jgi:hypothetical protein
VKESSSSISKVLCIFCFAVWKKDIALRYKPLGVSHNEGNGFGTYDNHHCFGGSSSLQPFSELSGDKGTGSSKFEAIVPHLGAHIAELTSIYEGNSDYLYDSPYLFNVNKLSLCASTLSFILKMQRLKYVLTPVRCIIAALNMVAKIHLKQSASAISDQARKAYELSQAVEPTGWVNPATLVGSILSGDEEQQATSSRYLNPSSNIRSETDPTKKPAPSSRAYERITQQSRAVPITKSSNGSNTDGISKHTPTSNTFGGHQRYDEEDEVDDEEDDGNDDEEGIEDEDGSEQHVTKSLSHKLMSKPLKLLRALSFGYKPSSSK